MVVSSKLLLLSLILFVVGENPVSGLSTVVHGGSFVCPDGPYVTSILTSLNLMIYDLQILFVKYHFKKL